MMIDRRTMGPSLCVPQSRAVVARRDGRPPAIAIAVSLGLDREAVADSADLVGVRDPVRAAGGEAQELGFETARSFALGSYAITGYPGSKSLHAAIAATRTCDRLICNAKKSSP